MTQHRYQTHSIDEDMSFEPYLFNGNYVWIWESHASEPSIWYAGRDDSGQSLVTLSERVRMFIRDRKLPTECIDYAERRIKELIRGKIFKKTTINPVSERVLKFHHMVNKNLDYFNLSVNFTQKRTYVSHTVLDAFAPQNLSKDVSPMKNDLLFDIDGFSMGLTECGMSPDYLGFASLNVTPFEGECSMDLDIIPIPYSDQLTQQQREDYLQENSSKIVRREVRPLFLNNQEQSSVTVCNFKFSPINLQLQPTLLNVDALLFGENKIDNMVEPYTIYSPPGCGKTYFLDNLGLNGKILDTDYYTRDFKDASLIMERLENGIPIITNHIEYLAYLTKHPIIIVVPSSFDETRNRMYTKVAKDGIDFETTNEWTKGLYRDIECLKLIKHSRIKVIHMNENQYLLDLKTEIIQSIMIERFKTLPLRINSWKFLIRNKDDFQSSSKAQRALHF